MNDLLNYLVKEITGKDFKISEEADEDKIVFTVIAEADSAGLIIGKEGKTIKAIQEIMRILGKKERKIVFVDVSTQDK